MTDAQTLLRTLTELEAKATPGPWHSMEKLAPSRVDHGFRRVADVRGQMVYAEAEEMYRDGEGYVWGDKEDDAGLIVAMHNSMPILKLALATLKAVEEYTRLDRHGYIPKCDPTDIENRADEILLVSASAKEPE